MKQFQLDCSKGILARGILLVIVGILCPAVITEEQFGIYETLRYVLLTEEIGPLLLTALKLMVMNSIRAVPHYMGAFLISDAFSVRFRGHRMFLINIALTPGIIVLVYQLIYSIYHIQYDFGAPALILVLFILFLSYFHLFSVQFINKVMLLGTLLFSVQCLDLVPMLSKYSFGRGEISRDIKMTARVFVSEDVLNIFSLSLCCAFLFCAAIQVTLMYKEYRLKLSNEKNSQVEQELHRTQMQAMRLRSFSEVQFLVHDLKSPLTTVQGLVSLSSIMEKDPLLKEYLAKISDTTTTMSDMISEILYEDRKNPITTGDLLRTVLAHASIHIPQDKIQYTNSCPERLVQANRIRLARAVANTLENSYQAIDPDSGLIQLDVSPGQPGTIRISVRDNGVGMDEEELKHIWEPGFSRSNSTGLGMSFIRQVVENHRGTISITSEKNRFTDVTIELEEYQDGNEEDHSGNR